MVEKRTVKSLQNVSFLPLLVISVLSVPATAQVAKSATGSIITNPLPYRQQPVDYFGPLTSDRMRKTIDRLETSGETLKVNISDGYLTALLQALEIPAESQLLVYSKTALNPKLVTPANPRAIYFNDDTYVGWVPGAATIEVASLDPKKGAIFYTVRQPTADANSNADAPCGDQRNSKEQTPCQAPPTDVTDVGDFAVSDIIRRETRCLTCHVSSRTLHVPGVLVGSYLTDETGRPVSGYSHVDLSTAWEKRFGGWYVTGSDSLNHLGNRVSKDGSTASLFGGPIVDLSRSLPPDVYPVSTSDLIAHLVLQHQIRVQNLLIRVVHESAFQRHSDALDRLSRELSFVAELKLPARISPTRFSSKFQGPNQTHPLRTFDLRERLFAHPVSFLLTSTLFHRIDDGVRKKILIGLWQRLQAPESTNLSKDKRQATIALIRKEVERLPDVWTNTP